MIKIITRLDIIHSIVAIGNYKLVDISLKSRNELEKIHKKERKTSNK